MNPVSSVRPGSKDQRLWTIYALTLFIILAIGYFAITRLRETIRELSEIASEHAENLLDVERLNTFSERSGRNGRSYLLTGDARFLSHLRSVRTDFEEALQRLRVHVHAAEGQKIVELIAQLDRDHELAVDRAVSLKKGGARGQYTAVLEQEVQPIRDRLDLALAALSVEEGHAFETARKDAIHHAATSWRLSTATAVIAVLLATWLTIYLVRALKNLHGSRSALESLLSELEQRNEDLYAFAGRVAHDLGNAIAPLAFIPDALRTCVAQPQSIHNMAERIERVTKRTKGLIEALLVFAQAGQSPDPTAVGDVRTAVDAAMEDLEQKRELVDARVDVAVEDVCVACGPLLLYVLLSNLIGNAIKFLQGREVRCVWVSAKATDSLCAIIVEDTGPGIPPESAAKIFEPFYRAPGTKVRGTGIGLATVHRIIEMHGGRIDVQSTLGEGTRFAVLLPLRGRGPLNAPSKESSEHLATH